MCHPPIHRGAYEASSGDKVVPYRLVVSRPFRGSGTTTGYGMFISLILFLVSTVQTAATDVIYPIFIWTGLTKSSE